jgi:hypothetical protein
MKRRCSVCGGCGHDQRYHNMPSDRRAAWIKRHPEHFDNTEHRDNPTRRKSGPNVVRKSLVYDNKRGKSYPSRVYKPKRKPQSLVESIFRKLGG